MNVRGMLAAALGLLMVVAAIDALPLAICAAVAVLVGIRFPVAAVLAVLSVIGVLAFSNASPVFAMLSGLAAATYLLAAYPLRWPPGVNAVRYEVIVPALLFGCAALLTAALPARGPSWLELAVPIAVVLIYVAAVRPFIHRSGGAVER